MLDSVDVKRTLQFFFFFSKRSRTSPEIKFKQKKRNDSTLFYRCEESRKKEREETGSESQVVSVVPNDFLQTLSL